MTVRLLNTLATWILLLRGVANSRGIRYKGAPSKAKENVRGRARPLLKANRNPMQPSSRIEALTSHSRDRRTKPRFDLSFPVLLRTGGEAWRPGRSQNVGANGVFVLTDSPFMPRPNAEYVLRLPPELTKANQPLMILVLREGLAVRERARRRFFLRNRVTEPRLQILAKRRGVCVPLDNLESKRSKFSG